MAADELGLLPELPDSASQAAVDYYVAAFRDVALWSFTTNLAVEADFRAFAAGRALKTFETGEVHEGGPGTPDELAEQEPGPRWRFLRSVGQAYFEMLATRAVDNFLQYMADIILVVLRKQPDILKTRKQSVTIEQLLQYSSIQDLVDDLVDDKVSSLSYKGFENLIEWCEEKGIPIGGSTAERATVVELVATRNIIAHNRGVVDARYHRAVLSPAFEIGQVRRLNASWVRQEMSVLHKVVTKTDALVTTKFGVPIQSVEPAVGAASGESAD